MDTTTLNYSQKGVTMDLSRDALFDDLGLIRLRDSYMLQNETSPQERFAFIANTFSAGDEELAQRLYDYMSKHWLSASSPQLSFGRTKQGLPIACFLPYLPDTTRGLIDTWAEVSELSVIGGGIGLGVGIRQPDEKSAGIIPHLRTYDASCTAYKQGQTRRGSYAAYLDLSHPEILQFLNTRKATGDYNYKLVNIHNAVNVPDDFMRRVLVISELSPLLKSTVTQTKVLTRASELLKEGRIESGTLIDTIEDIRSLVLTLDMWNLIDPHTGEVKNTISVKELWANILETRAETGEPYLHFIDTTNRSLPDFQKKLGLSIKQSNLCVVGETLVLTKDGNKMIKELVDQSIDVWNGNEYSKVTVIQTGMGQTLIEVLFSDGSSLICTPYHKFLIMDKNLCFADHIRVEAQHLHVGFFVWKIDCNLNRTIVSVVKLQSLTRIDDTYCFKEPRNQTGVFNGLLTGRLLSFVFKSRLL
jgi:ribonucleoside-diphosphate reductase alpha chain